jgi:UDP-N-acetylglucosamine--N-acetylmuramyl-(pentapeptide) pyrophosphoryl-undecaprenol N-acetylglucosamine transferase
VEPFLFAMDREMKHADLIVCRAGATTIAEIAAVGRPAVLIPLPTATDDHQRKNAEQLVAAGAAEMIEQPRATGELLAGRIGALVTDRARLVEMAQAVRRFARPDAAAAIVDRLVALADGRGRRRS